MEAAERRGGKSCLVCAVVEQGLSELELFSNDANVGKAGPPVHVPLHFMYLPTWHMEVVTC